MSAPEETTSTRPVYCSVYRSERKTDTYLYVKSEFEMNELPASLHGLLAPMTHVMDLCLDRDRRLANADVISVMAHLQYQGFYVQLPPDPVRGFSH